MTSNETTQLLALAKAVENLRYPSESDEPFDVFQWEGSANHSAAQALEQHAARGRKVNWIAIDHFFSPLKESDDADRYRALRRVLESQLRDLTVGRVGEGEVVVDVYILGRPRNGGGWAGLHTRSVET